MKQAGENSNSLKMVFRNRPENEKIVRTTAAVFASVLDPTLEEISDFKTAVSEAVTNSIIHGYENKLGIVKIVGKLQANKIILEISDSGKGIENIDIAKEPLYTTKPNLERSGMGFTIMESFMDKVDIESILDIGTKVTMEKEIKNDKLNIKEELSHATKD